jgi:hypothetical protein
MFDDIDLFTMLQLVARVVADSLGNFLKELPASETPGQPPQANAGIPPEGESFLMRPVDAGYILYRTEGRVSRPGRYCPHE